jgi:glycosyltransferase involved in cell wall biosynthesis
MGIDRLYSHQREAYERVRAGENVVVATATASGKSMCYTLPAFENALENPKNRALLLYPTKALAQDQLGKIQNFKLRGVHPATYDGDTPRALRSDIRRRANVVLTNPDMLNVGVLPNHEVWGDFLRNLRLVAVDEAHVLRGVFGSHVAAVLRRLRRASVLHGGDPQFVLTSATIANPQELAESLTGLPFTLVDKDGASSGQRRVVFRNPPLLDKEKGERRSLLTEGALVFANLVSQGVRTIAFARTRKGAELIYRYAADRVGVDLAKRISPYRAGYTPRERREIEGRLFRGELLGVVSTSALELGVDVGALDAVVCCGYPGSIASIWQQWGRAGRGSDPSLAVYIAGKDSLDQYLFENPRRVLGRRVEAARVTLENPYILGPHLLAAAHEAPLDADDEPFFGPAFRDVAKGLMRDRLLESSGGRLVYAGGDNPARNISLRSVSSETVMIADEEGELIGTAEATRAPSELHPGATYLHRGAAYEVDDLDLRAHRASARLEAFFYERAWLVTGQSRGILQSITERFPHCPAFHLSNGVDTTLFAPGRYTDAARATLRTDGRCVALYAGLHGLAQGLDQVLGAAELLRDDQCAKFALVGEGPEKGMLVRRATELGLSNLEFFSSRPKSEIPSLVASADVVLVTLKTHIPGAVPSKLYEAMASGKPVVLVATGEPAEIVREHRAGIVVAPGDVAGLAQAVRTLCGDPELRRELGSNGRAAVEAHYDREQIIGRFMRHLERAAASPA